MLDETDVNCRRFIDLKGLNIFQQCLEVCVPHIYLAVS